MDGERDYSLYYSRQVSLDDFGEEGQDRLSSSSVIVAGCGGLGSRVAELLVRAGVGRIVLVDPDVVEEFNLHRTAIYTESDVGRPKVEVLASRLSRIKRDVLVERVEGVFPRDFIDSMTTLVLECTDSMSSRMEINTTMLELGIPWVHAAVGGWSFNVMLVVPGETACLSCLYPESARREGSSVPVSPSAVAMCSSVQFSVALSFLLGDSSEAGILYSGCSRPVSLSGTRIERNPSCPSCGGRA